MLLNWTFWPEGVHCATVVHEDQFPFAIHCIWSGKPSNILTLSQQNCLKMKMVESWLSYMGIPGYITFFHYLYHSSFSWIKLQCEGLPFSLCGYSVPMMEHLRNTILFSVRVPVLSEKMYSICPRSSVMLRALHWMRLSVSSSYRSTSLMMKKIWPIFTNSMDM